jgi:hypothetical protein
MASTWFGAMLCWVEVSRQADKSISSPLFSGRHNPLGVIFSEQPLKSGTGVAKLACQTHDSIACFGRHTR